MSHTFTNHLNATHQILTGAPQPGAFFDKIASRDDYPCYASALDYIRPRGEGIPSGVMLPTYLMEGPLTWPGQHAGFLGPRFDPLQIKQDPNKAGFREESLTPPVGFSVERMDRRRELLGDLPASRDALSASASPLRDDPMAEQRELAYSMLLSGKVARAFDIHREDPKTRDRYGRHMFGQSILLARRLVEAGVPIVQANMGRVQNWDTHSGNFKRLKGELLPPLDRGVSALLDDLASTGRLDETLVVVAGEFGRTPRIGATHRQRQRPRRPRPLVQVLLRRLRRRGDPGRAGHRPVRPDRRLPGEPPLRAGRLRRRRSTGPSGSTPRPRSATASTGPSAWPSAR